MKLKEREVDSTLLLPLCRRGLFEAAVGITLLILLTLPLVDAYFDSNLVMHLTVQHMLLIAAGFLVALGADKLILVAGAFRQSVAKAYSELLRLNVRFDRRGLLAFGVAAALIAYWHLPWNFDAALMSDYVHIQMHLSLIMAGSLLFVGSKLLTPNMRMLSYILGCKAMAIFGAYLLVSPVVIYGSFPPVEQAEAGAAMVGMCIASDATILPLWLRRYFTKK